MSRFVSDLEPRRRPPVGTRVHNCRWPGCRRVISPRRWACREHWHKLPPDLQNRLARAARIDGKGRPWFDPVTPSAAYLAVAREAQDWIKEHLARGPRRDRRQGELGL